MRSVGCAAMLCALLVAACAKPLASLAPAPSPSPVPPTASALRMLAVGPTGPLPDPNTVWVPPPGSCHFQGHFQGGLPDPNCTPGLLNPAVVLGSDGVLHVNLAGGSSMPFCSRQFSTRLLRPPDTYTGPLKRRLMASYGISNATQTIDGVTYSLEQFYELDHADGLEDAGHPWSPANLWPQARRMTLPLPNKPAVSTGLPGPWAEDKDVVEGKAHALICAHQSDYVTYASALAGNWLSLQTSAVSVPLEASSEPEP